MFSSERDSFAMPIESTRARGATANATSTRFNLKQRVVDGAWHDQARPNAS